MNDRSKLSFLPAASLYPSWIDLLALLGVFLATAGVAALLVGLLQKAGAVSVGLGTFLAYLIQFVLTIAFAMAQRMRRMPRGESSLKFGLGRVDFTVILWGVIVIMATGIVIEPLLALFPDVYMEQLSSLMGRGGWMMLTAIVLAPILEEILFRGIVQDSLTYKYGPLRGILLGAALFGIVHVIPQQAFNAFLIGLVLGYIYYQTRSLVPVIVIHCINNAIAYFTWVISGEKLISTRQQLGDDTIYYIVYVLACIVFLLAFVLMTLSVRRAALRSAALQAEENSGGDEKVLPRENTNGPGSGV